MRIKMMWNIKRREGMRSTRRGKEGEGWRSERKNRSSGRTRSGKLANI